MHLQWQKYAVVDCVERCVCKVNTFLFCLLATCTLVALCMQLDYNHHHDQHFILLLWSLVFFTYFSYIIIFASLWCDDDTIIIGWNIRMDKIVYRMTLKNIPIWALHTKQWPLLLLFNYSTPIATYNCYFSTVTMLYNNKLYAYFWCVRKVSQEKVRVLQLELVAKAQFT